MELEELKAGIASEKHAEFDTLISLVRESGNPIKDLDDEGIAKFVDSSVPLKSNRDRAVQQGIKTHLDGNLDRLNAEYYDKKYTEEHPAETPEQKEIRDLKAQFEASEKAKGRSDMKATAIQTLTQDGLPVDLADILVGDSAEATGANLAAFKKVLETYGTGVKDEILKDHVRNPRTSEDETENYYTVDQINNMSPDEYGRNEEKVNLSLLYHQNR